MHPYGHAHNGLLCTRYCGQPNISPDMHTKGDSNYSKTSNNPNIGVSFSIVQSNITANIELSKIGCSNFSPEGALSVVRVVISLRR